MQHKLSRRNFVKLGIGSGVALVIGISLQGSNAGKSKKINNNFKPDIWVSVDPDNTITITITESEMGQGVFTTLPMMVAEEMDADWKQMKAIPALADRKYGYQQTGGSSSLRDNWKKLRMAGAAAREILLLAAANKWDIEKYYCTAEFGFIINTQTNERFSFGELVNIARTLPLPETVTLKSPEKFKIIGTSVPRLDSPDKITGKAIYGSDLLLKNMLTATVIHPPTFGGSVKSIDSRDTKKLEGIHDVFAINEGVAIVANDYWLAHKGAQALKIEWDNGANVYLDNTSIQNKLNDALNLPCEQIAKNKGNAIGILESETQQINAQYNVPYQAHAPLEPMTCTADVRDGYCEVWAPTQSPTEARKTAASLTQSRFEQLVTHFKQRILKQNDKTTILHTTLLGGGFGRRLQTDFVSEAVQISMAVKAPVRLIWSREEDIQHDFYRPVCSHKIAASLDKKGWPVAWWHRRNW